MKLIFAVVGILASCLFFIEGLAGQESTTTAIPAIDIDKIPNARFLFGSGDPCSNALYRLLNITDAKCSVQCYIQGGLQQGGYCDDNMVCQCNQIA